MVTFRNFGQKIQFQELASRGYIKGEGWEKEKELRGEEKYLGKTDDQAYFYSILFF